MESNVPGGAPKKKGMSKGCLVALIIGGVLLVLIIAIAAWIYSNLNSMTKMTTVAVVSEVQATDFDEGVDTVRVNAVANAFIEKLNALEEVDLQQLGMFMQQIQSITSDELIDVDESEVFIEAMVDFFPELEGLAQPADDPDIVTEEDTTTTE